MSGTNGSTTTVTPGTTPDSASVQVGDDIPISYTNLGNGGQAVAIIGAGGVATTSLVYNGTTTNDTVFGVSAS